MAPVARTARARHGKRQARSALWEGTRQGVLKVQRAPATPGNGGRNGSAIIIGAGHAGSREAGRIWTTPLASGPPAPKNHGPISP
jgi:hypothetical protein